MRKITFFKQAIKLFAFILFMSTFSVIKAQNILIIYDDSPTNELTVSLADTLIDEGFDVAFSDVSESLWDNSNPSLEGFDIVIHLNGTTYDDGEEMPDTGQLALVDFVENNEGYYIGAEWNGYEISNGRMTKMQDLILLDRSTGSTGSINYVKVTEQSSHPVLDGVSDFEIIDGNKNIGSAHVFETDTCVVLMKDETNDAVVVREFGNGKVLGFHHSGNYESKPHFSDKNIQQIIINFINWDRETDTNTTIKEIVNNSNIKVFPNPSSGILQIQKDSENTFETLSVIDMLGKNVYSSQLNIMQAEEQIDLSHLPKGIYLLNFKSDLETLTKRIIIK